MIQSTSRFPIHLALIMDGNGRWAERRGRPRWMGHRAGVAAARAAITQCARRGVRQLTLFAFSCDNWRRPAQEVSTILALAEQMFRAECDRLVTEGIRASVIGRRDRIPATLRRAIDDLESRTAAGRRMALRIALDYSSREAIANGLTGPAVRLPQTAGRPTILPPVDLLVRTGGERRLSDFLLWECAYAELHFLDVLFPDLAAADIDRALEEFAARDRRFGALSRRATA
jgi:undecaprenyl diphosphate synthase